MRNPKEPLKIYLQKPICEHNGLKIKKSWKKVLRLK